MSKAQSDPLMCEDLDEVVNYEVAPNIKVLCTRLSLHDLELSYAQIVELALAIKEVFPVQSYVTYPRSLYLTFSTYLDMDSIIKIKGIYETEIYEIRSRTDTVRDTQCEPIVQ